MKAKIMTHMISHYPHREASLNVARALIDGGASFLEIQFPFSDPSADGATIQAACTKALASGFTLDEGFELVKEVSQLTKIPIFIMSYASLVYARGVELFCEQAAKAGAKGLIIPDLPFDKDEGLYSFGKKNNLHVIPVLVPNISEQRLEAIQKLSLSYIYGALRVGITGSHTSIGEDSIEFLNKLAQNSSCKVLAGFGIDSHGQIEELKDKVYSLIVGSALVKSIPQEGSNEQIYKAVKDKLLSLLGS
ncbi:tryptophan synthase subunit alpha [Spirochaeta cellobiosiphila]|uniref:tryptophan synthase subunit alpha n=1 Tax=Spirochaeta cellobiosiphila TaxID=504483 RepID=UPI0004198BF9|nr:tryptophan synthase subunit alpha [Spirochaeta cellobiosiphila]